MSPLVPTSWGSHQRGGRGLARPEPLTGPQHPLESGSRSRAAPGVSRALWVPSSAEESVTQRLWPRRGPGFAPQSQGQRSVLPRNPRSLGLLPFLLLLLFSSPSLLFPFLLISRGFSFVYFFVLFFPNLFPPLSWFFLFCCFFFFLLFKHQTKEEKPAMGALEPGARLLGGRYRVPGWLLGALPGVWGVGVLLALGRNRLPCCVEVLLESGVCSGSPESLSV